eukprot:TRINITY_DN13527_c0_g1_i2.p1 TRINITY_DN13527_c0_g1~~TRINITY_DN13527_c0_g1_i2.p1  ORF type:complete len:269 (+),score=69.27 TRINITY_DN13527_c0_g1_i2:166-972(+)
MPVRSPLLGFFSKYVVVDYDVEDKNALVAVNSELSQNIKLTYRHDVKANQGTLVTTVRTDDEQFGAELMFDVLAPDRNKNSKGVVPLGDLVRTMFAFPQGAMKYVDPDKDFGEPPGLSAVLGAPLSSGIAYADYRNVDRSLDLKFKYKDEKLTLTPSLYLPSMRCVLAFKRRFNSSNKLSLTYDFSDVEWSAVYKKILDKEGEGNLKLKIGYDSSVRMGWASLWVGREGTGAARVPFKTKMQFMLQLPQDDLKTLVLLFKAKKRIDLF